MNNIDKEYRKNLLVKEMLEVKRVLTAMDPLQIFKFTKHIKHKKIFINRRRIFKNFPGKKSDL